MTIFETYSKRKNGLPDVYQYDRFDTKIKNQIYHLWTNFSSQFPLGIRENAWKNIHRTLCAETGAKKNLCYSGESIIKGNINQQIEDYFDYQKDIDVLFDAIEIILKGLEDLEDYYNENYDRFVEYQFSALVTDLNQRFRENGIGYEYVDEKIIRIDNQLLHKEVVQSVLALISDTEYKNVNEEYLRAHEHFRFNRNHECLNDCLKAFESTMKIICKANSWPYEETATAKTLIKIILDNKLIPNYHESQLNALSQLLISKIPTIRNKNSGHGQGAEKIIVQDSLACYMLYVTGATIKLFIESQKSKFLSN